MFAAKKSGAQGKALQRKQDTGSKIVAPFKSRSLTLSLPFISVHTYFLLCPSILVLNLDIFKLTIAIKASNVRRKRKDVTPPVETSFNQIKYVG